MTEKRRLPDWWPKKIVSGGQTGVDRAALDWAIANGVPHGGWCPKGRRAEDGEIPAQYNLIETRARNYSVRTRRNVRDSDGTLVVNAGDLEGGTSATVHFAQELAKPYLVTRLDSGVDEVEHASRWLAAHPIKVLNVAGPRELKKPGIYQATIAFLDRLANTS